MWRKRFARLLELFALVAVLLIYAYVQQLPDYFGWLTLLVVIGIGIHEYVKHEQRVKVAQGLPSRCEHCSYDTRANFDRCSECGEPIPPR